MPPINTDQGGDFLGRLRDARALVLRDAESFRDASTVLEHIGQVCAGKIGNGLKAYETAIVDLATNGDNEKKESIRRLFNVVRVARNKAVHDGAFTRHLSNRLVELIQQHYDQFDSRYRGLIPLKRVFIPEVVDETED